MSAPIGRRRPCHVVGDGQSAASRLFGALRCQNRHRSNTSVALGRFGHFVFFSTIFFSDIWTFFFQSTLVLLSNPPLNTISVVFFLSYLGWKSWKKIRIIKVFLFFFKKKRCSKRAPQPSTRFCRRFVPLTFFSPGAPASISLWLQFVFFLFHSVRRNCETEKKNCEAKKKSVSPAKRFSFALYFCWVSKSVPGFYWVFTECLLGFTGFQ